MSRKITRRQFLKRSATAAAAAAMAPHMRLIPGTNVAYAAGPSDAIVVFVQLFGGNDGLNTVYPLVGPNRTLYEDYRPTLALPDTMGGLSPWQNEGFPVGDVLNIGTDAVGDTYALHPAMTALHDVYDNDGKMAVIHSVHYPHPNHSHFRSEEIWYTADPLGSGGQGWFGSYLNLQGFGPTDVPGVIIDDTLNPLFTPTTKNLFAFDNLTDLEFPAYDDAGTEQAVIQALYGKSTGVDPALFPELVSIGQTGDATIEKINEYYLAGGGFDSGVNAGKVEKLLLDDDGRYNRNNPLRYASPLNPLKDDPASSVRRLSRDMRHVAATIRADVGARFFHVGIGGFDSHSSQEDDFFHSYLLKAISESVAGLYNDLKQSFVLGPEFTGDSYEMGDLSSKVVIVTVSEFGRTTRQNSYSPGAAGTDHATSSPQFVVGGDVIGGQYGQHSELAFPSVENDDDLVHTYDFRDMYGTILERWLNVSPTDIGPGPGKIFAETATPDDDGKDYTVYTPIPFLAP